MDGFILFFFCFLEKKEEELQMHTAGAFQTVHMQNPFTHHQPGWADVKQAAMKKTLHATLVSDRVPLKKASAASMACKGTIFALCLNVGVNSSLVAWWAGTLNPARLGQPIIKKPKKDEDAHRHTPRRFYLPEFCFHEDKEECWGKVETRVEWRTFARLIRPFERLMQGTLMRMFIQN